MVDGETAQEAYDRGHLAGEIAGEITEQLRRHDAHFLEINGSIDRTADELAGLRLEMRDYLSGVRLELQQLRTEATAAAATVVTTAKALKDAEDARRNTAEAHYQPVSRGLAILGAVIAAAGLILAMYLASR